MFAKIGDTRVLFVAVQGEEGLRVEDFGDFSESRQVGREVAAYLYLEVGKSIGFDAGLQIERQVVVCSCFVGDVVGRKRIAESDRVSGHYGGTGSLGQEVGGCDAGQFGTCLA